MRPARESPLKMDGPGVGRGDRQRCPCACIHACPGGPAAASSPQSSLTGALGSCCVNYLPSVVAGCSL